SVRRARKLGRRPTTASTGPTWSFAPAPSPETPAREKETSWPVLPRMSGAPHQSRGQEGRLTTDRKYPRVEAAGIAPASLIPRVVVNDLLDNSGHVSYRERLLFGVIPSFSHHLFRGTKLVFHLLAVANLSDPLDNDPVAHTDSLLDDEDIVHLVLDDD